jgi:hypothetical protein
MWHGANHEEENVTGDSSDHTFFNPHTISSHHTNTMTAAATSDNTSVLLSRWLQNEKAEKPMTYFAGPQQSKNNNNNNERQKKESIIRRTTIAYGIAELLLKHPNVMPGDVHINNFVVSVCNKKRSSRRQTWDDIEGVGMKSSGLSLTIEEPSYLRGLLEGEDCDGQMGRCLEVFESVSSSAPQEKSKTPTAAATVHSHRSEQENNRCHLFARLLYELFTGEPFPDDALADSAVTSTKEPAQKKAKSNHVSSRKNLMLSRAKGDFDRAEIPFQIPSIVRMQDLGTIPASVCLMTQNLLECALRGNGGQSDDSYKSLEVVCQDLHLLLLDPDRFLFDNEHQNTDNMKLLYRRGKLYGRDKEETLITDAFCRVSSGKSEAFFIGGFSGSGKSMLVNSLRNKVHCLGGYVIKHKFDVISKENPLSGVISAFNQICRMIKDRARPVIAKKLLDVFGVDFSLLMRLLPNVRVLFPEFVSPAIEVEAGGTMNARSVCFTLLRFVRVISSPRHPVMVS